MSLARFRDCWRMRCWPHLLARVARRIATWPIRSRLRDRGPQSARPRIPPPRRGAKREKFRDLQGNSWHAQGCGEDRARARAYESVDRLRYRFRRFGTVFRTSLYFGNFGGWYEGPYHALLRLAFLPQSWGSGEANLPRSLVVREVRWIGAVLG